MQAVSSTVNTVKKKVGQHILDMAKQVKDCKFLVIVGTESEFAAVGFGILISYMGRILVCDNCNEQKTVDEKWYYIPVLNRVFCKECFDNWVKSAEHYSEDDAYEKRYFDAYKDEFVKLGIWDD